MAEDKLQKELLDIQEKLGGTREVPPEGTVDKLQWHLDKLEELAGGGGGGEEVPTFEASTFDFNPPAGTFQLELAEEDIADILENTYTLIKISAHDTIFPFVLSTGQASTVAVYTSVFSLMGQRFLLDFGLQAGQIVSSGAAMINTSNIADIKVDNTSVVDQTGSVNLVTKTAYNAETNKLATESDIPDIPSGGGVYYHLVHLTMDWYNVKVQIWNSTSEPYTSNTFKAFLTSVGAHYNGSGADNMWLYGYPVIWTQPSIGTEWGANSNSIYTDLKVVLRDVYETLNLIALKHTLTITDGAIVQTYGKVNATSNLTFRTDTVTEL